MPLGSSPALPTAPPPPCMELLADDMPLLALRGGFLTSSVGSGRPSARALSTSLYSWAASLSYLGLMAVPDATPLADRYSAHFWLPPHFISLSCWSVHESMAIDRTNEMCTPRDLRCEMGVFCVFVCLCE